MLKEVVNRLRGQVRIRVECAFPERVLNLCSARNLAFWDLAWESPTEFTCRLSRQDLRALRQSAEKLNCTIEVLRREGWRVIKAKNDVLSGIRITAELLRKGKLVICKGCRDAIREFGLYRWQEDGTGDRVRKQDDHAMDDIRYFAATVVAGQTGQAPVFAGSVLRSGRI